mgnify:CR=1 FL=1
MVTTNKFGFNQDFYGALCVYGKKMGTNIVRLRNVVLKHPELGPLVDQRPDRFGELSDNKIHALGFGHVSLFEIVYNRLGPPYYIKLRPSGASFSEVLEGIVREP